MKKYFGTDGIRGVANKDLTPELALSVGRAIGKLNAKKVVIGKDTRTSGDMLLCALVSGLVSEGVWVDIVGLVSTPALATISKEKYDYGIMITASHNSSECNGIKIFEKSGNKISETEEKTIENFINNPKDFPSELSQKYGEIFYDENLIMDYLICMSKKLSHGYYNLKVCFDLANGASVEIAKKIFKKCMFKELCFINTSLDGSIINKNCGATHLEMLKAVVVDKGFDVGFAFDGDADRIMCVDSMGNVIDGDDILYLLALEYKTENRLSKNTVVGTVMSNFGLESWFKSNGIDFVRVDVGDKNIKEYMLKNGLSLGGESSGHIIKEDSFTGDGINVAIDILNFLNKSNKPLNKIICGYKKFPQIIENVVVKEKYKKTIVKSKKVKNIINQYEPILNNKGRVLIRASGTEPLIRILVEGENKKDVEFVAKGIRLKIREYMEEFC